MVRRYNLPPLHASYYLAAIDAFADKFPHAVFVLVGDNLDWGRKNILERAPRAPIFALGDGRVDDAGAVGRDLALLAACNHTVLSYGTFSFWAGFLAGGHRLTPAVVLGGSRGGKVDLFAKAAKLGPFALPDEGLKYKADWE